MWLILLTRLNVKMIQMLFWVVSYHTNKKPRPVVVRVYQSRVNSITLIRYLLVTLWALFQYQIELDRPLQVIYSRLL